MGTIVPRLTANFTSTSEAGKYLYCDGSTFDTTKYPKLYAVLGTNQLPDLRERFLEGNNIGGQIIEAGLPNIKGQYFDHGFDVEVTVANGAFYPQWTWRNRCKHAGTDAGTNIMNFDASRCSSIYGKSDTVQPPALAVNFYIKAK